MLQQNSNSSTATTTTNESETLSEESEDDDDDEDTGIESDIRLDDGVKSILIRKVSTSMKLEKETAIKDGYLYKQSKSFQRWRRRYFKLQGRKLYYGGDKQAILFHEIDLVDLSVAECNTRHSHSFQLITPYCRLVLSAESRQDMDKWISTLKSVASKEFTSEALGGTEQFKAATSGEHVWYVSSHARPTYCNVCRDALSGVAWHGLSCEVCKIRTHKRCATKVAARCKWTTLDSVGSESIFDDDGCSIMPHQWVEGNLPVSAKCSVCDRICGSMLRLQDWRCLWCRAMVHSSCKDSYPRRCPLGACRISVLPPVSVKELKADGSAVFPPSKSTPSSPLLVLVNTKSGDSQGVKFMRRFKTLLNPAQVYDLMAGGPEFGLKFFKMFESFRVLVCGGDGSVGWVLSSLDKLNLLTKCQVGVLPLGTGNDLARVLGWGNAFDDETQLPQLIEKFERAHTKMMDRWSVLTYEGPTCYTKLFTSKEASATIMQYENSVASHLSKILSSDDNSVVISSAKVLCETVKAFLSKVGEAYKETEDDEGAISTKCAVLRQKLDNLLKTLQEESAQAERAHEAGIEPEGSSSDSVPEMSPHSNRLQHKQFIQREALMSRANSLKKAVRQIIEHAERAVDEQNAQTEQQRSQHARAFGGKRKVKRSALHASMTTGGGVGASGIGAGLAGGAGGGRSVQASTSGFSCGSCARNATSNNGRHACPPVRSHTIASSLTRTLGASTSTASGSMETREKNDESSASPSPGVASAQAHFDLRREVSTSSSNAAAAAAVASTSSAIHPGDSIVPEDPKTMVRLPVASASASAAFPLTSVTVQPPTPLSCATPNSISAGGGGCDHNHDEQSTHPLSAAALQATVEAARRSGRFGLGGGLGLRNMSLDSAQQAASDSEVPSASASMTKRTVLDVKHSFSDTSIREAANFDSSPAASRKISTGSTFRLADRSGSPSRGILPAFRRGLIASGLTGGSLIAEVLLLNADVLGVAASPLMDFEEIPLDHYSERRVMNNYFGIGLDAKIALEFHNKREESADKTRSRSKLYMLYGMLGTKELLQRTYKNLEQRVHLECDGHRIQLPSLQGIVVLNIPSYQGGANFWGNTKSDRLFSAQSFDDRVLEVVAVFGVIHCATSRVIRLQNHRIAQCRHVKIIITGDEPIPMQVDGEAWMQPSGYIQIVHKNRAQVLVRNRQFEATLKTWTERLKREQKPPPCLLQMFTEEESNIIINFLESFNGLTAILRKACGECPALEKDLNDLLLQASLLCQKLYPTRKLPEVSNLHYHLTDALGCAKQLTHKLQTYSMKADAACSSMDDELTPATFETLEQSTKMIIEDIRQFTRVLMMSQSNTSLDQPGPSGLSPASSPEKTSTGGVGSSGLGGGGAGAKARSKLSQLLRWRPRLKSKDRSHTGGHSGHKFMSSSSGSCVSRWDVADVGRWLDGIGLVEYRSNFALHDITGRELIRLERRDLKELGITKVGHIKRLQHAILELGEMRPWDEATEESVSSL